MNKSSAGHWQGLDSDGQRPRYEAILSLIPTRSRVLDVGCGEGLLGVMLAAAHCPAQYLGLEPNARAAASAIKRGVPILQIRERAYMSGPTWDAVVFNEVLYYFDDPVGQLRRFRNMMAPGGRLIASIYLRPDKPGMKQRVWHWWDRRRPLNNLHCADMVQTELEHWGGFWVKDLPMGSRLWLFTRMDAPTTPAKLPPVN